MLERMGSTRTLESLISMYDFGFSNEIEYVFNQSSTHPEIVEKAQGKASTIYQSYMRWFVEIKHWSFRHNLSRLSDFKLNRWGGS